MKGKRGGGADQKKLSKKGMGVSSAERAQSSAEKLWTGDAHTSAGCLRVVQPLADWHMPCLA